MPELVLLSHADCLQHEMPGHPERPERLHAVLERLQASGLAAECESLTPEPLDLKLLSLIHPAEYVENLISHEPAQGLTRVDPDTYMCPGSIRAARLAAGACVAAVEQVLAGNKTRAFCAVRPPGHHAEIAEAMGFCLFNSIAIAAETALQHPAVERVAILDFDVHHCNGTVDIFKDRPEVLVCSTFQAHHYPHRYLDFSNDHIVASPLAAGSGSEEFRQAVERDWEPAINQFKPDLILVSAGFDAHLMDPLANLNLSEEDFYWVSRTITEWSDHFCKGRLVSTLEGGYELSALAASVEAHVRALAD